MLFWNLSSLADIGDTMNSMFLNDDDNEALQDNWKNSEVMRIFVASLKPETKKEAPPTLSNPEEHSVSISELSKMAIIAEAESALGKLKALAASMSSSNEKASYIIERAIGEIESIVGEHND